MEAVKVPAEAKLTLKTAREVVGMTQKEAAQAIGVEPDTLRNWEQGKSFPDVRKLKKIEIVYGVPYDRLIFLNIDFG